MCCCGKPSINGEPGAYSWDGKSFSTRQPAPPSLHEGDELLYDEPGRCGGIDSHSHHFRVVKAQYGGFSLLVRHGGGDERISLGYRCSMVGVMQAMDSNARYWLLHDVYNIQDSAVRSAETKTETTWRQAAAEKRIKTRKQPRKGLVKVWIEARPAVLA